jgi:hypothetical protein
MKHINYLHIYLFATMFLLFWVTSLSFYHVAKGKFPTGYIKGGIFFMLIWVLSLIAYFLFG